MTDGKYQYDLFYVYQIGNDSSVQWTTYQLQNDVWRLDSNFKTIDKNNEAKFNL